MARRKNKKSRSATSEKSFEKQNQQPKSASTAIKNDSEKKQSKIILEKSVSQAQKPINSGISVVTCLAGMFLSLVLGLYLGTLLPQAINKLDSPQPMTPAAEAGKTEGFQAKANTLSVPANLARTIADLENEVKQHPDSAKNWASLGDLYFDTGQIEKSIHSYEHSLKINPDNPDVLTDMGIMYREMRQFDKAVDCFRKAVKIDPQHTNALFNEGVVCAYDLHDKLAAIAAWKKLLELNPGARAPSGISVAKMIEDLQ